MTPLREPSIGLDARTGGTITGWDHVAQSLTDIFTTRFGERVMREWYGSFVPRLLGSRLNEADIVTYFAAITSAIEQWEPRYRVTKIVPLRVTRLGALDIYMEGAYRPRALLGDMTVEGARRLDISLSEAGLLLQHRNDA